MAWFPVPAVVSILLDANRVAPNRSHATDGIIGDALHAASLSDHNPDTDGGVHACDITNDLAGGFNAWAWAQVVAGRIIAGTEKRVKYLVSNDGAKDVIFNPAKSLTWRQNGTTPKQDHRSHLHVSVLYTDAAENDTSPFFVAGYDEDMTLQDHQAIQQYIDKVVVEQADRTIGTIQTTLREVTIPAVVAGVSKAAGVDPKIVSKAVADELARNLTNG